MAQTVLKRTPDFGLADILRRCGLALLRDQRQFEGLLRDRCVDGRARELFALVCAHRLGIPQALLEPSELPSEARLRSLAQRLVDEFWLSAKAASWAVVTWQRALVQSRLLTHGLLEFACTRCKHKLRSPRDYVGRKVMCPECGYQFVVSD